jgi:hypothetical protein
MNESTPRRLDAPASAKTPGGPTVDSSASPISRDPIRNPPSLPGEVLAVARKEASPSAIRNLLESCLRMLKLTGGSRYWTGDTQAALEFMEAAVAEALEVGALRSPRTATGVVVPEITASSASAVECGLQMAGIEVERSRSAI